MMDLDEFYLTKVPEKLATEINKILDKNFLELIEKNQIKEFL